MPSERRSTRRRILLAAAVAAACETIVPTSPLAHAQTWISATSGNWSNPLNWTTLPVSGNSTVLTFAPSGTQTYIATDDFPGPFAFNQLALVGSSTGSVTIAAGSLSSFRIGGTTPIIVMNETGPVFVTGRVNVTADMQINAANNTGSLVINGPLTGNGSIGISKPSGNAVVLNGASSYFTGQIGASASIELGHQDALGSGTFTASGATLSTSINVIPSGTPPQRPIFSNPVNTIFQGLVLGGKNGYTLSGPISGAGSVALTGANTLNATWALTGTNSFTGALVVNGSSTPGVTSTLLLGSPAALGTAASISINGAGAQLLFGAGSTPATITQPINIGNGGQLGAFSDATLAQVTLSGNITGTGSLSVIGNGVVTLSGSNTFSGPINLVSGITSVSNDSAFGATTISLAGGSLLLDPAFTTTSRNINVATLGSTVYVQGNSTFGGVISNSILGGFTKAGQGTLALTGVNTFTNELTVVGGTVSVGGISGRLNAGAGSISVFDGSSLVVDNTAANISRIGNSTVTLAGGDFAFLNASTLALGNGSINSSGTLNIGTINQAGAGLVNFTVIPNTGANASVRFNRMNRTTNNGTQVRFIGPQMGNFATTALAANATNVSFANAPALTAGILPWAIVDTQDGNVDFATYNATNGIQRFTGYLPSIGTLATDNIAISSGATVAGGGTCNAVKLTGGSVDLTLGTLTVNSGGILVTGATTISGGTLNIGNPVAGTTGNVFNDADLTVTSRINGFDPGGQPVGLAKSGAGVMVITAVGNNYPGDTRILGGILRVGTNTASLTTSTAIPTGSLVRIAPGAMLDLVGPSPNLGTIGFTTTIGSLAQTTPLFTVGNLPVGTVNIGSGTNTLTVGGDNNSTAINLNIIGGSSTSFTKTGNGTLTVVGPQAFSGTLNINNGAIELGTHLTNGTGFSSASRINITASAGDATLAFDPGLRDGGYSVPIFTSAPTGRVATIKFITSQQGGTGVVFNSPITLNSAQGAVIDSSSGTTIAGVIGGTGPLITASSDGVLVGGNDGFALNITGANTYTGATTLTAISTLFGSAAAFGNATTAIGLGSTNGEDNPELASSIGGLVLTRNIVVNNSTDFVASTAYIGTRAPAGSSLTSYNGSISIAGSRNRLVLFSDGSRALFNGTITGGTAGANLQIGRSYGPGMDTTHSDVTLAGANTYAGGTTLVAGTLQLSRDTVTSGSTVLSGPLGTGTFTVGTNETSPGYGPALVAQVGTRTIANPVTVNSNFVVAPAAAPFPLTLSGAVNLGAAARVITVNPSASLTMSAPVTGSAGSALVKEGGGVLTLNATATYPGPTVAGEGTLLFVATQRFGDLLAVAGGATARLTAGGAKVIVTPSVSVDAVNGGQLDITDNSLIVNYTGTSPLPQVNALLASGFALGNWNGPGINSSSVLANPTPPKSVGIAEASAIGAATFAGEPVDSTSLLIRYTVAGDSNLDGIVNVTDLGALATNWQTSGRFWFHGDFNYDGLVDVTDLGILATNWQVALPGPAVAQPFDIGLFVGMVPEPSCLTTVIAMGVVCARRRR